MREHLCKPGDVTLFCAFHKRRWNLCYKAVFFGGVRVRRILKCAADFQCFCVNILRFQRLGQQVIMPHLIDENICQPGVTLADNKINAAILPETVQILKNRNCPCPAFVVLWNPTVPVLMPDSICKDVHRPLKTKLFYDLRHSVLTETVIVVVFADRRFYGFLAGYICLKRFPVKRQFVVFAGIAAGIVV